jgi:hypothetical protein
MDQPGFLYGLNSVKKLTAYLNSLESLQIKSLEDEKIAVRKSFAISFNYPDGIMTIKVSVDFLCRTENPEPVKLFGTTVQCDFKLFKYEDILKLDESGQVDIPNDLLITLLSVSFSTGRGILAAQTAGTDYANLFLPLISTSDIKILLEDLKQKEGLPATGELS